MERIARLFSNLIAEPEPPRGPEWDALAAAVARHDDAAVVAGMQACQRALRAHGRVLLHELLGMLVEQGFERAVIERCVAMGGDIRRVDDTGRTLMHRAIEADGQALGSIPLPGQQGRRAPMATFEYLRSKGGPVLLDAGDDHGTTPLMYALDGKHDDIVSWLIQQGAALNATDNDGNTALLRAVERGSRRAVELLLARGADPLHTGRRDRMNAMTVAARRLDGEVIRLLQGHGVPMPTTDGAGRTALHVVASLPHATPGVLDMARYLLDSGVPADAVDEDGCTPLIHAASTANMALAKLLLEHGADAAAAAGPALQSRTVLHIAAAPVPPAFGVAEPSQRERDAEHKLRGELVELLIDAGARIDATDDFGCTPLLLAVDQRCRPAYLALQVGYLARGMALSERELMLMAERAVMPVNPQIAFTRLGKECVALRGALTDLRGRQEGWQREREVLRERVRSLQASLADSDAECGRLAMELADAVERNQALAQQLAALTTSEGQRPPRD